MLTSDCGKNRKRCGFGYLHLFCIVAVLVLGSCGDDELKPNSTESNRNSNAFMLTSGRASGVTERSNTNLQENAMRLEIPHLIGGVDNLFVVHTVPGYGTNFCMEYDCGLRASRWTAYEWYRGFSHNESGWSRYRWQQTEWEGDPFQEDPLIPQRFRTTLADHRNNGYDRGHILGSADRLNSREINEQTYYLSNIHPQMNSFNAQGIWFSLEDRLRKVYDNDSFRDTLYVVKGGTIGKGNFSWKNNLVVPKYFFMALLCKNNDPTQGGYKALGFWMPHKSNVDTNYAAYAMSIDELEEKTGLDFFCNLPDDIEETVEKNLVPMAWGLN